MSLRLTLLIVDFNRPTGGAVREGMMGSDGSVTDESSSPHHSSSLNYT